MENIKAKDIEKILDYIKRQTLQYLNITGDNIPLEVRHQLNQLLEAIDNNNISSQTIDAYLELWQPMYIPNDHRPTVALTIYDDGDNEVMTFLPASFFEINHLE